MSFLRLLVVLVTIHSIAFAHHHYFEYTSSTGFVSSTLTTSISSTTVSFTALATGGSFGDYDSNNPPTNDFSSSTTSFSTTTSSSTTVSSSFTTSPVVQSTNQPNNNNHDGNNTDDILDLANLQTASDFDGGPSVEAGQSPSVTDPANFINFCSGQTLTNGTQITTGSCNGIPMGQIPSSNNMISTIITNPKPGDNLPANQDFTVNIQVSNLNAGTFTNPNNTYYAAPQQVDNNGLVIGHTHITIQTLGNSLETSTPPDPSTFAFFKGVNDDGNGKGGLSASVVNGLPAGVYRVCTMTSASNHQPVLMPVAQRGAQDDCTKFTVTDSNNQQNDEQSVSPKDGVTVALSNSTDSQGDLAMSGKRRGRIVRRKLPK